MQRLVLQSQFRVSGEVLRPTESCFIVLADKPKMIEFRKQYDETNSEKAWNPENGDLRFANVPEGTSLVRLCEDGVVGDRDRNC